MPLAGLILTDDDALALEAGARTLLPVAGQSLIEYQVRIARAAGAGHIAILVDRIPAGLVAAFDRLRDDGIDIDIARDAREAADRIHPDERLLVVAGGLVAARGVVDRMAEAPVSTLLTLPDSPESVHFERIDANDRWAGLALLNGQLLRDTAAMLGDWTLGPTLLRAALQAGAARTRHEGGGVALVRNEQDATSIAHFLASGGVEGAEAFWPSQVVEPIVRRLLPKLIGVSVPLQAVLALPLALLGAALVFGALGWEAAGFAAFLVAGFPAAIGKALADIAARPDRPLYWANEAKRPVLLALMMFAGWAVGRSSGGEWGPIALGLWAGVALMLQPSSVQRDWWHADADILAIEMLMCLLIGQPVVGLMIAVGHAVMTQFALVRTLA